MGQLILLLIYLAIIAAIVVQVVQMVRYPAARTPGRMTFVLIAGALITGVIYFGVLH